MAERQSSFASDSYLQAKALWKGLPMRRRGVKREKREGTPFASGRDPKSLESVLLRATEDMGWTAELSQAKVITDWAELVGETTAPHTNVVGAFGASEEVCAVVSRETLCFSNT